MKRLFVVALGVVLCASAAGAVERPSAQVAIDSSKVLRGSFVEEKNVPAVETPLRSVGTFVIAPANGLIWAMQQPIPTTTIITPTGAIQDFGGLVVKLHAKNIRHLYDMVGGALAGDWSGIDQDFTVTRGGTGAHWLMTLTPREDGHAKSYRSITISGGSFVENIALVGMDGSSDVFSFSNEALGTMSLVASEAALFAKVGQ